MATMKEAAKLTSELTELSQELHSELTGDEVDFDRIVELADHISEQADGLAAAFTTVNQALGERITEVKSGSNGSGSQGEKSEKDSSDEPKSSGKKSNAKGRESSSKKS